MSTHTLGIIVNGATGRICSTQHLKNSLIAMRDEGGLAVGDKQVVPRPLLVGRDAARLAEVARTYGVADWTTDLDAALANPAFPVFFDAAASGGRVAVLTKAIAADASCVEGYASRGISREALGDVDGARADYAKSIEVEVKAGIARHLAET